MSITWVLLPGAAIVWMCCHAGQYIQTSIHSISRSRHPADRIEVASAHGELGSRSTTDFVAAPRDKNP